MVCMNGTAGTRDLAILVVVAAAVLAAMAAFWDCPHPSSLTCIPVERLAAVVATLSLTLAPIMYFVKQRHSDKIESQRATRALHAELGDVLSGLDPDRHSDFRVVDTRGKTFYFMSRLFNHDIYDSLVNSGKITFVDAKLQQSIQDIFQHIKDHNSALKKIRKMEELGLDHIRAHHLYQKLGNSELLLLKIVPITMRILEKQYDISTSSESNPSE